MQAEGRVTVEKFSEVWRGHPNSSGGRLRRPGELLGTHQGLCVRRHGGLQGVRTGQDGILERAMSGHFVYGFSSALAVGQIR